MSGSTIWFFRFYDCVCLMMVRGHPEGSRTKSQQAQTAEVENRHSASVVHATVVPTTVTWGQSDYIPTPRRQHDSGLQVQCSLPRNIFLHFHENRNYPTFCSIHPKMYRDSSVVKYGECLNPSNINDTLWPARTAFGADSFRDRPTITGARLISSAMDEAPRLAEAPTAIPRGCFSTVPTLAMASLAWKFALEGQKLRASFSST